MAHPSYHGYTHPPQRGTLYPGQTILVNRHNVQVERYLSQGGFAHVYVVRSAVPLDNSTQHVLKRIAVADQNMLREVQKEVEVMRKLSGHPNIVKFIDASWHTLPNGTFEVFILMEFCAGGGMIDMMNRRLRERLTESEILQIFTDVCEGVAVMHNQNPPLLHRDLKIENILQANPTLYKLCDFGSAITVPPRPSMSIQELRALEADLGRHTTLQYRAPEMVDVYQRRPIDEKSDIWALGVLLYKLCYYTTPFEEHGPLAILNVQYRIPPYPVYSHDMNALIASMLRELGTQRPTIFELLNTVHHLRGTKSKFHYSIPPQKLVSLSPRPFTQLGSGLGDLITTRPTPNPSTTATSITPEGIVPMRRGRPMSSIPTPSVAPLKGGDVGLNVSKNPWLSNKSVSPPDKFDDPWAVPGSSDNRKMQGQAVTGFGDSFSSTLVDKITSGPSPVPQQVPQAVMTKSNFNSSRDAFDGLSGIPQTQAPPTLAEAAQSSKLGLKVLSKPPPLRGVVSRSPLPQPTQLAPGPISPRMSASRTGLAAYRSPSLSIEQRYPSLDELDRSWKSPGLIPHPPLAAQVPHESFGKSPRTPEPNESKNASSALAKESPRTEVVQPPVNTSPSLIPLTPKTSLRPMISPLDRSDKKDVPIGSSPTKYRPSRPALARKRPSSQFGVEGRLLPTPPTTKDWLTGDDLSPKSNTVLLPNEGILTSAVSNFLKPLSLSEENPDSRTMKLNSSPTSLASSIPGRSRRTSPTPSSYAPSRTPSFEPTAADDTSSDEVEGPENIEKPSLERKYDQQERRQNSIHDLVDLYGGASRLSQSKSRKVPSSITPPQQSRRMSGTLIDISEPSGSVSNLLSPSSIVPKSRAELANRHSRTRSHSPGEIKLSPSTNTPKELPPKPSPTPSVSSEWKDKRPRSMFLLSKSKPDAPTFLQPPLDEARPRRTGRRSSISDMVDLYESLVNSNRRAPPPIAQKPPALRGKTPSPIHSRFPAVSSTGNSFPPKLLDQSPAPRAIPRRSSTYDNFIEDKLKIPKQEPEIRPSPNRRLSVSPISPVVKPSKDVAFSVKTSYTYTTTSIPTSAQSPALASTRETNDERLISSPAPERPYQGVSQLISQWQRKTEEAEQYRRNDIRGRPLGARFPKGKGTGQ